MAPARRVLRNQLRPRPQKIHISQTKPCIIVSGLDPVWMNQLDTPSAICQAPEESESHTRESPNSPRAQRQAKRAAARPPSPKRNNSFSTHQSTNKESEQGDEHHQSPARKRRKLSPRTESPRPEYTLDVSKEPSRSMGQASARGSPVRETKEEANKPSEDPYSEQPSTKLALPVDGTARHASKSPALEARSSRAATPRQSHSHAASPVPSIPPTPQLVSRQPSPPTDPNVLEEKDLPQPFLPRQPTPESFADTAASILHNRFPPLPNPAAFIKPLTSHNPSTRSTETLLALAQNTHAALVAWQDEYLRLDQRTAPLGHPPKKPATGGRAPVEPEIFQQMKEIELWGHILGVEGTAQSSKPGGAAGNKPSNSAAFAAIASDGKRLRRRGADTTLVDGGGFNMSENEGSTEKRTRKPPRRFDIGSNGVTGRKRRRLLGDDLTDDGGPMKRGRLSDLRENEVARTASPTPSRSAVGSVPASDRSGSPAPAEPRGRGRGGRGGRRAGAGRAGRAVAAATLGRKTSPEYTNGATKVSASSVGRRGRAKSAKRSRSMAKWWAERKRNQMEERLKHLDDHGGSANHSVETVWGGPLDPTAWPGVLGRRTESDEGADKDGNDAEIEAATVKEHDAQWRREHAPVEHGGEPRRDFLQNVVGDGVYGVGGPIEGAEGKHHGPYHPPPLLA